MHYQQHNTSIKLVAGRQTDQQTDRPTDRQTNQPTDQRTNMNSYRCGKMHMKRILYFFAFSPQSCLILIHAQMHINSI